MAHTYEELKDMTVAQLRDIAKDIQHDAVKGFLTMHKDHLLPALCTALNIPVHAHHVAVISGKTSIKTAIRQLKKQRDAAVAAHDRKKLPRIRAEIHSLKRKLRRAAV